MITSPSTSEPEGFVLLPIKMEAAMTRFKRRILSGAVIALACSTLAAPTAFAATAATSAPDDITVAEFKAELVGSDLSKWNGLTSTQQTAAIAAINEVADADRLPATDAEAKALAPELAVSSTVETTSVPTGSPAAQAQRSLAASAASAATYDVTSNYNKKYSVLGVTYSNVGITYRYQTGSGRVLKDYSCVGKVSNYIPLRDITNTTNKWVSGGKGNCVATWTVKKVDGWGGTTTSDQGMVVNGSRVEKTWGPQ